MIKKYEEPILLVTKLINRDCICTSTDKADNYIPDDFDDYVLQQ